MHRLTIHDTETREATCSECGPVKARRKGFTPQGNQQWLCPISLKNQPRYYVGGRESRRARRRPHLKYRGDQCVRCGLQHEDKRVFDVHHKDGNHSNNSPDNLETVCPTCHRLHHLGIAG